MIFSEFNIFKKYLFLIFLVIWLIKSPKIVIKLFMVNVTPQK